MTDKKYLTVKDLQMQDNIDKKTLQILNYERLGLIKDEETLTAIQAERDAGRFPQALEPISAEVFKAYKDAISTLIIGGGPIEGLYNNKDAADLFLSSEITANFWKDDDVKKEIFAILGGVLAPTATGKISAIQNFVKLAPRFAKMMAAFVGGATGSAPWADTYGEVLQYGLREGAGEGAFQVIHKFFPYLRKFFRGKNKELLEEFAEQSQKILSEGGLTITPARLSKSRFVDLLEQIAEISYAGGTRMSTSAAKTIEGAQEILGRFLTKEFLKGKSKDSIKAQEKMILNFLRQANDEQINLVLKEFLQNGKTLYKQATDAAYNTVQKSVTAAVGDAKIIDISGLVKIFDDQVRIYGGEIADPSVRAMRRYLNQWIKTGDGMVDFNTAKAIRSWLLGKTKAYTTTGTAAPQFITKLAAKLQNQVTKKMKGALDALSDSATVNKELLDKIWKEYEIANDLFKGGRRTFNNTFITGLLAATKAESGVISKKALEATNKIFNTFFKSGERDMAKFFFRLLDDGVAQNHITKEAAELIRNNIQGSYFAKIINEARDQSTGIINPKVILEGIDELKGPGKNIIKEIFKGPQGDLALKNFTKYVRAIETAQSRGIESAGGSLVMFGAQAGAAVSVMGLNFVPGTGTKTEVATGMLSLGILGGPYAIARLFTSPKFVNNLINAQLSKSGTNQFARYSTQLINHLVNYGFVDPILANTFVNDAKAAGILDEKNTKNMEWYDGNDLADETSQEVEEEKAGNISVFFPNKDEVVDTTMDAMPTTEAFDSTDIDSTDIETEINIPEANTEIMAEEIITPVSAVPQATPLKGPAGMSFDPATLEKLEQVDMPLFRANHGGIASLLETKKPKQMVV
tara:strand:+ start:3092 stop:5680 length:2589 start_codon:yes stop_codon:yes gene_type:complete